MFKHRIKDDRVEMPVGDDNSPKPYGSLKIPDCLKAAVELVGWHTRLAKKMPVALHGATKQQAWSTRSTSPQTAALSFSAFAPKLPACITQP
ncbi:hypothetical protein, partial [Bradyrhizobium sp. UFLA06-06]